MVINRFTLDVSEEDILLLDRDLLKILLKDRTTQKNIIWATDDYRKLRVVCENAEDDVEWLKWAERAVQSVYGYEFQGDNLLLARENILLSYMDYFEERFKREAVYDDVSNIALIVSWNLWQMDGLNFAVPFCEGESSQQLSFFDIMPENEDFSYLGLLDTKGQDLCRIKDWRSKETIDFKSLMKGVL